MECSNVSKCSSEAFRSSIRFENIEPKCSFETLDFLIQNVNSKTKFTDSSLSPFPDEIAERLSENYRPAKVEDGREELKLKLENIIQSTNSLDFSDFTKINNDKNNNNSRSAALIDGKQEVSSEQDSGLKSDCSADSSSVSSEQSTSVPSISADPCQARSQAKVAVKSDEIADPASETVRKPISDPNSADTSDLVNDLSIISSTNLSSANSSFDSASFSTSDYVILNLKSMPANGTAPSSAPSTCDSPSSPQSPKATTSAQVLSSTPKQTGGESKSGEPSESKIAKQRDSDQQKTTKDPAVVRTSPKEPANKADPARNAKQIKDDSFKKDRSSFFPSLPKSSSAETISKLKSNISSVSTNSSNLFNKTITTISNNLLTNITNKSRNRAVDAKKQAANLTSHQDTRKQEVDKQPDKQPAASSHSSSGKQTVRAPTIDEERIMNAHAEDYGSLNCDHEPGLEFDDSELEQAAKLEDGKPRNSLLLRVLSGS